MKDKVLETYKHLINNGVSHEGAQRHVIGCYRALKVSTEKGASVRDIKAWIKDLIKGQ